jgi:diguanylate cyclase (GGDEF)-like protein
MKAWQLIANTARILAATLMLMSMASGPVTAAETGAAAEPTAAAQPRLGEQIDAWVRRGFDRPDEALAALRALDAAHASPPAVRRALLQARGTVLAQSGRDDEAAAWVAALLAHAQTYRDPQAEAAASLVRALAAQTAGRLDLAAPLAQSALDTLRAACPSMPAGVSAVAPGATHDTVQRCDYRTAWQALQILQQCGSRKGVLVNATAQAQAARDLAAWAVDPYRLTVSTAELAWMTARSDGFDAAQPLLKQAQRLAARSGDPVLQVRVMMAEALIASQRDELDAMRRLAEAALPLARRAESPRLEASVLTFLSDVYVRQKRPAEALSAAERGLPIARRHNDLRTERVLTNNAGLAKIGLSRIAEGKQDLARVEELARSAGLTAQHAQVLREYDDALTAAGDLRGALDLYHRERALSAQIMSENREAALKQLQLRNDRESKQRDIELLARNNQLTSAALTSRDLTLRVWAVAALVLVLAVAMVTLLYRRVRETNRQLVASQAQLRVQSERDPLTHLANRRHFLSVMQTEQARGGDASGFDGAMLLVDIDHFKHVNDGHGHAAGDLVLCEVARRLNQAVRGDDLVVRWGGEEFLVLALKVPASHAEQMAARVLKLIGDTPVMVQGRAVQVTVSIGYARFPLPPNVLPVGWEQAINLADMALYTAKSQGRNRAVGIVAAQAPAAPELRRIEADFDRAWHEGRITLKIAPGPVALA